MTAPPADHAKIRAGWLDAINVIEPQVMHLTVNRGIWSAMLDAIEDVDADDTQFLEHYVRLYIDSLTIGVRRLVSEDAQNDKRSLARLIDKIRVNFDAIDVDDPSLWPAERFTADKATLVTSALRIKSFADNHVAHLGPDPTERTSATFGDLNTAVDAVVDIFGIYYRLLTGTVYFPLAKPLAGWDEPFRQPLFDSAVHPIDRDRFGVPFRMFGSNDDDFFGAIGRITAIAALVDERFAQLVMVAEGSDARSVAGERRSELSKRLAVALADRRSKGQTIPTTVDSLDGEVDTALQHRNSVVHSLWPHPTLGTAWGWRQVKPRSDAADAHIKHTETTRHWLYDLTVTLSDLVQALSKACDQLGPPPELVSS